MSVGATTTVKVLVLGPQRERGRQLLASLADVRVLAADDDAVFGRETTSLRADFGRVELSTQLAISLVAVDRAETLQAAWPAVGDGLLGALVLAPLDDRALADCADLVAAARSRGVATQVVLRLDGDARDDDDLRAALELDGDAPVLDVDPAARDDVRAAVLALLQATLRAHARDRAPAPSR